jgi:peroxiredoxin
MPSLVTSHIPREGLTPGSIAPSFRLPQVNSCDEISIETYRGTRILLVFSDPKCNPCNELGPKLAKLAHRTPDIQVLMVSRGNMELNRDKVASFGISFPVVIQRHWEISQLYATFATPVAYLIDQNGSISSDPAEGPEEILRLLRTSAIVALLSDDREDSNHGRSE